MRRIAHIDMDCFYAAVEIRERPELRDKPVAVGGTSQRGVLTTCNYVAREYGVRSAMSTYRALQLCPHLVLLPTRFALYREVSARIREIFQSYTDLVEPLSLDEAYLDLSHLESRAAELAASIRERIREETGLTASAGVAPNKLVAKIASDWNKPDGQYIVPPSRVAAFMQELPVKKIWGIGPKGNARLQSLGIQTCGQMQELSHAELVDLFGSFGLELYNLCRGFDDRPVNPNRKRKSLSNERTFGTDLKSVEECRRELENQHEELLLELRSKTPDRPIAKLFVKLKFSDFQRTTAEASGSQPDLKTFDALLEEAWGRSTQTVRLLGLGVRFAEVRSIPEQLELSFNVS